jgi:hypothetical protein
MERLVPRKPVEPKLDAKQLALGGEGFDSEVNDEEDEEDEARDEE